MDVKGLVGAEACPSDSALPDGCASNQPEAGAGPGLSLQAVHDRKPAPMVFPHRSWRLCFLSVVALVLFAHRALQTNVTESMRYHTLIAGSGIAAAGDGDVTTEEAARRLQADGGDGGEEDEDEKCINWCWSQFSNSWGEKCFWHHCQDCEDCHNGTNPFWNGWDGFEKKKHPVTDAAEECDNGFGFRKITDWWFGHDVYGNYGMLGSRRKCGQMCERNEDCEGFSFFRLTGHCYTYKKKATKQGIKSKLDDSYIRCRGKNSGKKNGKGGDENEGDAEGQAGDENEGDAEGQAGDENEGDAEGQAGDENEGDAEGQAGDENEGDGNWQGGDENGGDGNWQGGDENEGETW